MGFTATIRVANDNAESIRRLANLDNLPAIIRPESTELTVQSVDSVDPDNRWATHRIPAIIFFAIATALATFAVLQAFSPRDTGLLAAIAGVSALCLFFSLPKDRIVLRGGLAICAAIFVSLMAVMLVPATGFWPEGAGTILFAGIFLIVALITRAKLCLALGLAAIIGSMADADGLIDMKPEVQIATLSLLGTGLIGGLYAKSRLIACGALVTLTIGGLSLLATLGLVASAALAVTAFLLASTTLILRTAFRLGVSVADAPLLISLILAGLCALGIQLVLTSETGAEALYFSSTLPAELIAIMIVAQVGVLVSSVIDWIRKRSTFAETLLLQLVFGLGLLMVVKPSRIESFNVTEPALLLVGFFGSAVLAVSLAGLFRAWQEDRPVLTALSGLFVMIQVVVGLRMMSGSFDIGVAGLVCAGVAFILAVIMAIAPRKLTQEMVS